MLAFLAMGGLVAFLVGAGIVMWPRTRKLDGHQKYGDLAPDETDGGNSTVDEVTTAIGLGVDSMGR